MEEKQKELIGKFNQLRLELGDVVYAMSLAQARVDSLKAQLKAVQAQFEQNAAELEKAKGVAPVEPEVGLTEDAKRELAESIKVNSDEAPVQAAE